ncbi:MAG: hypothetical protein FWC40_08460, partial [Proteobacteria bacterium]|nr:hypothetical protein [Pseudomonadota bacterium]
MKKMTVGLIGLACGALFLAGCTEPIDDSCGTCFFGRCVNGACVCDAGYDLDDAGHCTECAIGYAPDPAYGLCVKVPGSCPANCGSGSCQGSVCVCSAGYTVDGSGACTLCAPGYVNVSGQCVRND